MGQSKLKSKPNTARKPDLRNRPFLVINAIVRPLRGVNTSEKGWTEKQGAFTTYERVKVVDRVSANIMRDAYCILDLTRREVVTSRFDHMENEKVFEHFLEKYQDVCEQGMRAWIDKVSAQMARDPKFIAQMQERALQLAKENGIAVLPDDASAEDAPELTDAELAELRPASEVHTPEEMAALTAVRNDGSDA
jgi:hypothetical protein